MLSRRLAIASSLGLALAGCAGVAGHDNRIRIVGVGASTGNDDDAAPQPSPTPAAPVKAVSLRVLDAYGQEVAAGVLGSVRDGASNQTIRFAPVDPADLAHGFRAIVNLGGPTNELPKAPPTSRDADIETQVSYDLPRSAAHAAQEEHDTRLERAREDGLRRLDALLVSLSALPRALTPDLKSMCFENPNAPAFHYFGCKNIERAAVAVPCDQARAERRKCKACGDWGGPRK